MRGEKKQKKKKGKVHKVVYENKKQKSKKIGRVAYKYFKIGMENKNKK